MIQTGVFSIAGNLLGKIGSIALRRVFLAWGLESDIKRLEENLSTIKAVLLDAEEKKALNHELHLWLGRLKDFCYDAQDVLDELEYEVLRKQVLRKYGSTRSKVRHFFSASNQPLLLRFKMSHKIKELRERLDEIAAQKSKFHLAELVDHRSVVPRETDSLVHSSGVIGRHEDKEIIVTSFLRPDGQGMGERVSVLPIVGMGGLGKTTFAKILYNDERVEEHFQLRIWVWVSNEFDKKQILIKLIKSLTNQNRSDLDQEQLQICIRQNLKSKRFLLVLDDMWCDDRAKWVELADVLEGGADGSRVIVTTRSKSVAKVVGTVPTYNLRGLPDQDCLSLFKKWAFKGGEGDHSPKLMEIGKDIVKKCKGLPLALKTLGSLLYSRNDEHYWEFIRDNEIWQLEQETDILPALRISYDEMPSHLKPCFAFCSLSRKGYLHNSDWLALVWMAEGFLQPADEHQDPEDIAMQYIKEMHSRSLLEDFYDHSSFVTFKLHDLMHDLASSAGQSECAVVNYDHKSIPKGIRHLALSNLHLIDKEDPSFLHDLNRLHTMIFNFKARGPILESFFNRFISTCGHLRVLQFKDSSFEVLPSSIGDLKHLRVLNLSGNRKIKKLPDSICKLHNLLYLSVYRCSELEELPRDIRNMVRLRCLFVTIKQNHLANDGIGCLKSLRTLCIGESENINFLLQGVQHLTSLCELRILRCTDLVSLPLNLKNLKGLKHLEISTCARLELMEWGAGEDIELSLQSLILYEIPQLVTLPPWLKSSSKTLQSIKINACVNFSSLPDWLQNFTSLRRLYIEHCPRLLKLPRWIRHLTALEILTIKSCQALSERFKEKTNEDWQDIAHVSNVRLYDVDK